MINGKIEQTIAGCFVEIKTHARDESRTRTPRTPDRTLARYTTSAVKLYGNVLNIPLVVTYQPSSVIERQCV